MEPRHSRDLGALSEDDRKILSSKRILVAGCGGLGCYIIELLLRLGVGHITAADGDSFDDTNLNRQLYCTPISLGVNKAEAAAARAALIDPAVGFRAFPRFLDEDRAAALTADHDVVMDALDSMKSRRILARACDISGVPLIHGAVSGWQAQIAVCLPGDGLMEKLYPDGAEAEFNGCPSFTPAVCAGIQVSECVKLLLGAKPPRGRLFTLDLRYGETYTIKL